MNTLVRRALTSATAGALLFAGAVATSGTAAAATDTHCKTSSKSFDLPGKPDVKVSLTICVRYNGTSGGYRHYQAWFSKASWDGTSFFTGGKRFNDFSVLQLAQHGRTTVKDCAYGTCLWRSVSSEINNSEHGSKTYPSDARGYGIAYVKTKSKNWTADAVVDYDIADDGKPGKTWNLAGTAAVS